MWAKLIFYKLSQKLNLAEGSCNCQNFAIDVGMQDRKCCTFCSAKALSSWEQFLGAVILNNLNFKNHCPVLHTYMYEGLYLAVMFSYSCLLYITWNCLQICCWPYLIHFYICYLWLIFFLASKILLSIWLKYWVCDFRRGSLDPWGITCFP